MQVRHQSQQVTGEFRYWLWRSALNYLKKNIFLGAGIGHRLYCAIRTRAGFFRVILTNHVHSIPMTILYQTGIIGLSLFLAFYGSFLYLFFRNARKVLPEYQPLLVGLFVGFVCAVTQGAVEPVGSGVGMLNIYLLMGFAARLLVEQSDENREGTPVFS